MSDPQWEELKARAMEAWHKPPVKGPNGSGYLAGNWEEKLSASLDAILPHLRRMHFQEAADLLDAEAERMHSIVQSGEWQAAAFFLRGLE